MLYESDVIDAVARYLQKRGWAILRKALPTESGVDVIAEKGRQQIWIEAKGETSSRVGSRRYGQPFNRSQVWDHVAKAFYVAAAHSEKEISGRIIQGALALPDTTLNHNFVDAIAKARKQLGIPVYWVKGPRSVREA